MSIPSDEKISIQVEYFWEAFSAAISLNYIKATFLAIFTAWYQYYRSIYEFKIASLIFAMWVIRFSMGTVQAIKKREWTSTQCKAGLYEMGGFCAVTCAVWAVSQIVGVNWVLGTWLGAWLMAEFAAVSAKILPALPEDSPLTSLISSFIFFFHGRISNMSDIMSKLGRRQSTEDIESKEKTVNRRQKKLDNKQSILDEQQIEIDKQRKEILDLKKEINLKSENQNKLDQKGESKK